MTKLEEFVKKQYQGMAHNFPWKFQNHDWEEENSRARFWLRSFVREVRERAKAIHGKHGCHTSSTCDSVAFNEVVKELLEEPKP